MKYCSTNHSSGKKHYIYWMRKKWTPQEEPTDSLIKFRDKRKWQIALRRYVLEEKRCPAYASFFGLDIKKFREWIEIQFENGIGWHNYSSFWQFDHIVPIAYFDFAEIEDMKLAWNFVNIRPEVTILNKHRGNKIDVIAAKGYFEELYKNTGYSVCKNMLKKIEEIEFAQLGSNKELEKFIIKNQTYINTISSFSNYQYEQLNMGMSVEDIAEEGRIMTKMGIK